MVGWAIRSPTTAAAIMATNIKVVMKSRGCFRIQIGAIAAKKM